MGLQHIEDDAPEGPEIKGKPSTDLGTCKRVPQEAPGRIGAMRNAPACKAFKATTRTPPPWMSFFTTLRSASVTVGS